jgi:hypothetical protein
MASCHARHTLVVRDVAALVVDLYTKIKYLRTEVVWSCGSIPQYLIFHYSTHTFHYTLYRKDPANDREALEGSESRQGGMVLVKDMMAFNQDMEVS